MGINKKTYNQQKYLVLNPTEEKVVKALSSKPVGLSISELSRKTNLARTSMYHAVYSLLQKNLVRKHRFKYTLAANLTQINTPRESTPREQIKKLMQELLGLKRGEIVYSIESEEEIRELFSSKKELVSWQKEIAKKGVVLKGIGTIHALNTFRTMLDSALKSEIKKRSGAARFTKESLGGPCTLVSFRNSVIFFSRTKNFFFRINNQSTAMFTQRIIDILYNLLEYHPIVP